MSDEYDDEPTLTGWSQPVDLTDALNGEPLPGTTVCSWRDGDVTRALFYPNEVHSVFGEPESMKSWLLLHAAAQQIGRERHVIYIDMEATDRSIVERMRSVGAGTRSLRRWFHYFRPDTGITMDDQEQIAKLVRRWKPTLVVLDGVTEAFSLLGLNINAPEDTARWFRNVARRFQATPTKTYPGPAIVELDHVVKNHEARNGWAIGSQHKKAGIKGAAYSVEVVRPFGLGRHGVSRIFLEKDSAGAVAWTPHGRNRRRLVAEFHAESERETGSITTGLETPIGGAEGVDAEDVPLSQQHDFRLLMERVWEYVDSSPSASGRDVRTNVTGKNNDIAAAVDQLLREGFLRNEGTANRRKLVSAKRFQAFQVIPGKKSSAKRAGR